MKTTIRSGFTALLLVAAGCSSATPGGTATGGSAGGAKGGSPGTGGLAGAPAMGSPGTGGAAGTAGGAGAAGATGGVAGTGGAAGGTAWLLAPVVPPALAVPAGAVLAIHDHGAGTQIYTCTATAVGNGGAGGGGATYAWVLKAPDAKLTDENGTQVGTHGMGPEWTSTDGSVVNGTKAVQASAPEASAIPWLLLRATSTTGTGVFSGITYIQRVNTSGGVAPGTGCNAATVNTETSVAYSAEYDFYKGGGADGWMTEPADVPAALAPPPGTVLKMHDHGIGTQVYTCTASAGADAGADAGAVTYAWVLKGPDAVLYDVTFAQVGTHGAGPKWTSTDGSVISGQKLAQASAPAATAIPWLLLKATPGPGAGVFSDVTNVQRLNTAGGLAPATGCDAATVGAETSVPYSADYYFFSGGASDGGTHG